MKTLSLLLLLAVQGGLVTMGYLVLLLLGVNGIGFGWASFCEHHFNKVSVGVFVIGAILFFVGFGGVVR